MDIVVMHLVIIWFYTKGYSSWFLVEDIATLFKNTNHNSSITTYHGNILTDYHVIFEEVIERLLKYPLVPTHHYWLCSSTRSFNKSKASNR